MNSIPASQLVTVNPAVVGTGGNPLSLSSIFLTHDTSIPIGTVMPFADADSVSEWFGPTADEALLANVYFLGFDNSTIKPGSIMFAQYPAANVGAYLRGGSLESMTLTALQLLSGTLIVTTDGVSKTSGAINLSGATSFSDAASLIDTAFTGVTGPHCSYDSLRHAFVLTSRTTGVSSTIAFSTGTMAAGIKMTSATGAVLSQGANSGVTPATAATNTSGDLTAVSLNTMKTFSGTLIMIVDGVLHTSGTIAPSGAADFAAVATAIAAGFSGTPLACTWDDTNKKFILTSVTTGANSSIGFATGTLAASFKFTSATGAMIVQGVDAKTNPGSTMDNITNITQNWAPFMTAWEPDLAGKTAFADWSNAQNQRYLYVAWDSDVTVESARATSSFGYLMKAGSYNGVCCVYPKADKAAFICGAIASINFSETNGRITLAYKGQSGMLADIVDPTVADNLIDNGYSFYGAYATANDRFVNLQNGNMPGMWKWIDSYVNQIYLNNQFQLAFLSFLKAANSVPYNASGYAALEATALDPINEAVNFGSIVKGVPLSNQQKAIVNAQAGTDISSSLEGQGWYFQVLPATAQNRGLRKTPPVRFWYMDGQSIQLLEMASVNVQ